MSDNKEIKVCNDCRYFKWDDPHALHIFWDGWCTRIREEKDWDNEACKGFKAHEEQKGQAVCQDLE